MVHRATQCTWSPSLQGCLNCSLTPSCWLSDPPVAAQSPAATQRRSGWSCPLGEGNGTLLSDGQTVRPHQAVFGGRGARPWLGAASRGVSGGPGRRDPHAACVGMAPARLWHERPKGALRPAKGTRGTMRRDRRLPPPSKHRLLCHEPTQTGQWFHTA